MIERLWHRLLWRLVISVTGVLLLLTGSMIALGRSGYMQAATGQVVFVTPHRTLPGVTDIALFDTTLGLMYRVPRDDPAITYVFNPTLSPDGAYIAYAASGIAQRDIYVTHIGRGETHRTQSLFASRVTWSPNGKRFVLATGGGRAREIFIVGVDGRRLRRLTNNFATEFTPTWSPDGTRIAFTSLYQGALDIFVMNADGSYVRRLHSHPANDFSPIWSPDGGRLLFFSDRDGSATLYLANLDDGTLTHLNAGSDIGPPLWSPDGRNIAYFRSTANRRSLYVIHLHNDGSIENRLLVNNLGSPSNFLGGSITWSADPNQLVFIGAFEDVPSLYTINITTGDIKRLTHRISVLDVAAQS
ncbi:MAG: hypothetical protein D6737_17110 [Chloroflexi bacterium]|nr:MAG: hypothetical protein D6737_17110 [Chloroflexota bacterium]